MLSLFSAGVAFSLTFAITCTWVLPFYIKRCTSLHQDSTVGLLTEDDTKLKERPPSGTTLWRYLMVDALPHWHIPDTEWTNGMNNLLLTFALTNTLLTCVFNAAMSRSDGPDIVSNRIQILSDTSFWHTLDACRVPAAILLIARGKKSDRNVIPTQPNFAIILMWLNHSLV